MPKTGNLDDEKSISFTISAQSLRATKFFNGLFGVSLDADRLVAELERA